MSSTSGISSQRVNLPAPPTADKSSSVQLKIEGQIGKISDLMADIQAIMKELQALEPPESPGSKATDEDKESYQKSLADFQSKVASLNRELNQAQGKLAKAQATLSKLQNSDLPQAQREDAQALKKWADDAQAALENQTEATASSTQDVKDLTDTVAQDKVRLKTEFIKKAIRLEDGSDVNIKVAQLAVQIGDAAAVKGTDEAVTAMPKAPAGGIPGPGVP